MVKPRRKKKKEEAGEPGLGVQTDEGTVEVFVGGGKFRARAVWPVCLPSRVNLCTRRDPSPVPRSASQGPSHTGKADDGFLPASSLNEGHLTSSQHLLIPLDPRYQSTQFPISVPSTSIDLSDPCDTHPSPGDFTSPLEVARHG